MTHMEHKNMEHKSECEHLQAIHGVPSVFAQQISVFGCGKCGTPNIVMSQPTQPTAQVCEHRPPDVARVSSRDTGCVSQSNLERQYRRDRRIRNEGFVDGYNTGRISSLGVSQSDFSGCATAAVVLGIIGVGVVFIAVIALIALFSNHA